MAAYEKNKDKKHKASTALWSATYLEKEELNSNLFERKNGSILPTNPPLRPSPESIDGGQNTLNFRPFRCFTSEEASAPLQTSVKTASTLIDLH